MRWVIHAPGSLSHGFGSPCRGEGRWSLNLAHVLAQHGHEVVCVGRPGIGEVPGCKVTSLDDKSVENWKADVVFDTTWADDRLRYKADLYIHAYWAVDEKWTTLREDYDARHWCAYATLQVIPQVLTHPDGIVGRLMPFPAVETFRAKDNFDAPGIFWDVKYGFEDGFEVKRNIISHAMLENALDLAEEFGLILYVLHKEHVFGGYCQGPVRSNLNPELGRRLLTSPNVKLFEELPNISDVYEFLGQSRLMVTNGDPPISPMPIEAVSVGCIPIQWEVSIFRDAPWRMGQAIRHIADREYLSGEVKNGMRRLLSDRTIYTNTLDAYREAAKPYLYENAYRTSMESVFDMLARTHQRYLNGSYT